MVGDSLGDRDHAEVACGVLGYGGCGVVGVVKSRIIGFVTLGVMVAIFYEGPFWKMVLLSGLLSLTISCFLDCRNEQC